MNAPHPDPPPANGVAVDRGAVSDTLDFYRNHPWLWSNNNGVGRLG